MLLPVWYVRSCMVQLECIVSVVSRLAETVRQVPDQPALCHPSVTPRYTQVSQAPEKDQR